MTLPRLTLSALRISNGELPVAEVTFTSGMNLIVGASNTGKTFIFEAINFLLGGKDALRRIPQATGYTSAFLDIDPSDGPPITLRRAFEGGNIELSEFGNGRNQPATSQLNLSPTHTSDPATSLSAYLLATLGLSGRQVRKNANGVKQALTFRHVCQLTLIGETKIIQQASPIFGGQKTSQTADGNVFAYFLTGQDDSSIVASESSKDRNTRLSTEELIVDSILQERLVELSRLMPDRTDIDMRESAEKLEAAIKEASRVFIISQEEISSLERQRAEILEERTEIQSRQLFVFEQLKRLRLLDQYYESDLARLQTAIEASRAFHTLPEGTCPLCQQSLKGSSSDAPSHEQFESACQQEIQKIADLRHDLAATTKGFEFEEQQLSLRLNASVVQMDHFQSRIQLVLLPTARASETELETLIRARTTAAESAAIQATIRSLEERLSNIRAAQAAPVPKVAFENRATTSVTTELCSVIHAILKAWKYPDLGVVTFDSEKADLVIGGQDRANQGKGYRAITYAAFAIGLMKYCRLKGIPHPGFVVLDTPVNPFKAPTADFVEEVLPVDRLSDDVKAAFFEYLAADKSGDQFIVIENESPPPSIPERVTFFEFTKNPLIGRYGFFPYKTPPTGEPPKV